MAVYRFDSFYFDTEACCLRRNDEAIALRPKSARLLTYFIENRERILSKSELAQEVWGSAHVQDHTLFQAVSELRRLPSTQALIRTTPNLGYRWIVPTQHIVRRLSLPACVAAAAVASFMVVATFLALLSIKEEPAAYSSLPALSAFSKAAAALQHGENARATALLEFALAENPQSIDSRLMLAESLLRQNQLKAAARSLKPLLDDAGDSAVTKSEYGKMAARNLMSHILEREGKLNEALAFAVASKAADVQAYCSVEVAEQRIKTLLQMQIRGAQFSKVTDEALGAEIIEGDDYQLSDGDAKTFDAEKCMNAPTRAAEGDPSACVEASSQYWYAEIVRHDFFAAAV